MTQTIKDILNNLKPLQDYFLFFSVVLVGVFTKVWNSIQKGKRPTVKWFFAELIVSFFVAFSVYAVFDQYFHMNKMFTYMVCAWGGSMSTLIHAKVEDLIESLFDDIKQFFKTKVTSNAS
jgi:hypothetical protein